MMTRRRLAVARGYRASGVASGVKKKGKDLALFVSDLDAEAAGVFTTNRVKAAPVIFDRRRIRRGPFRAIIVNSGNANACTGEAGLEDARRMASKAEEAAGLAKGSALVCSTGVIGVRLPVERIESAMPRLVRGLSREGFMDAAEAIMTTDAFPKVWSAAAPVGRGRVTVTGVAKGAGMIAPSMATMLAFFFTDAAVRAPLLGEILSDVVEETFNSIMVDNDTSTNDTAIIMANGAAGLAEIKGKGRARTFASLVREVAFSLAHMIVSDGEGATRIAEISVKGARSDREARLAARTVAGSLLVKTALFGADPNWGRVMAALGRSGARFDPGKVDITFGGVPVVKDGLDAGGEKRAARVMRKKEVLIEVDLKGGPGSARFWTSDLGHEYVRINSSYRT